MLTTVFFEQTFFSVIAIKIPLGLIRKVSLPKQSFSKHVLINSVKLEN